MSGSPANVGYPRPVASLPDHLGPAPVGKQQLAREIVASHQRARILDAATAVFAEEGFPAATVDDIVTAAEIGVGSFYALCSGKEDCLLRVYDRIVADAKEELAKAVAGSSTWEDGFCRCLRRLLDLIAEEPQQARIALVEIQTAGAPALERYNETLGEVRRQLAGGRARADAARWLPQSLEVILGSCLVWLLHRKITFGEAAATPQLFSEMAELALEPYLGEARTRQVIAEQLLGPKLS